MDWKDYCKPENWHEAANLFPLMPDAELVGLAEDIKNNDLQHEIVLFGNKVLDGRNRLLACKKAGIKPKFVKWSANGTSAIDFVISQNVKRRHLTTSQRAALAAKLVPQLEQDARQRQKAAGKHGAKGGRGRRNSKPSAQDCADGLGKSSALAAQMVGAVGERSVEKAVALEKKNPGILDRILQEEITLQKAIQKAEKNADKKAHRGAGSLVARYIAPPFNAFDPKQKYWKDGQRKWMGVLDPVLCEIMYRWFAPKEGGHILDLFAGESIAGIVATRLGYQYTGLESRTELVKINERQSALVQTNNPGMQLPTWICGDPAALDRLLPAGKQYDLIFATPPQPDLKRLNRKKKDGRGVQTYDKMLSHYAIIFRQAAARLKQNRFLIVKIRCIYEDEKGTRQSFFSDITRCLSDGLGLHYYNQIELMVMSGNCHETVLCFFKGENTKLIPEELGILDAVGAWPENSFV